MEEYDDNIPFDDEAEPDEDAWFAKLLFWRPSKLSDDRMQLLFHHFDGKWSDQTREAMQRFKAEGLDLNENWALTSTLWSCPACGRYKNEIFRLTGRGILLAKLELHHDHLRDVVWKRADTLFGVGWRTTVPENASLVLDRIRELAIRFSYALVCSECNSADGTAKTQLRGEIDPRFTFTVEEIGRFVTSQPNGPHTIDVEKARTIWNEQRPAFEHRLHLIDQLLANARSGLLAKSTKGQADANSIGAAMEVPRLLHAAFLDEAQDTDRIHRLYAFRSEFAARSTSLDSARLPSLGNKSNGPVRVPTDAEYAAYTDPTSTKWMETPSDWSCPICLRQKRLVMRMSNKKKWSGSIRGFTVFTNETDGTSIANRRVLFPGFRNDRMVGSITSTPVCSDCANVPTLLGQHDRSIASPILLPDEVRASLIGIAPHTPHDIDFAVAAESARANEPYGPAMDAFRSFRAKASNFATRYDILRRNGTRHDQIMAHLSEDVRVFHSIDDVHECRRLAEWLAMEGRD